jgi:N-acetylmuramoyl-L-alanine amidase
MRKASLARFSNVSIGSISVLFGVLLLVWVLPAARARPVVVVVDPGHGGTNRGARGVTGLYEKHLNLRAARLLRRHLQRPGLQVVLTRTGDEYLTLSERVRRANRARADLMISLHGNASARHDQQGYEAFVSSPSALRSQRRPASSRPLTRAALARSSTVSRIELRAALGDLARHSRRRRSLALGKAVMGALARTLGRRRSRGLQQADFDVLRGLRMPGLLVEMGFVDHPREGRRLLRLAYLQRVIRAIARGVFDYLRDTLGRELEPSRAQVRPSPPPVPRRLRDRRLPGPGQRRYERKKPVVACDEAAS